MFKRRTEVLKVRDGIVTEAKDSRLVLLLSWLCSCLDKFVSSGSRFFIHGILNSCQWFKGKIQRRWNSIVCINCCQNGWFRFARHFLQSSPYWLTRHHLCFLVTFNTTLSWQPTTTVNRSKVSGWLSKTNMAGDNRGKTVVELSSLPLQIFLFLNIYYAITFCIAELLLYVYKGVLLPYPDTGVTLGIEIFVIFLLAFFEGVRLFLGYKGNLAERTLSLALSLVLGIPVLFIDLFILLWQTYVLRIEAILVGIALVFLGLEIIFSIAAIFTFKRHQTMLRWWLILQFYHALCCLSSEGNFLEYNGICCLPRRSYRVQMNNFTRLARTFLTCVSSTRVQISRLFHLGVCNKIFILRSLLLCDVCYREANN